LDIAGDIHKNYLKNMVINILKKRKSQTKIKM